MRTPAAFYFLASIALIGCSSDSTTQRADAAPDVASLVGSWKGRVEAPETKEGDAAAEAAKAMANTFTGGLKLQFPTDGEFKLVLMGIPMEGDVKRTGNSIILTPKKLMGMTPDEAKKSGGQIATGDFGKPIQGTVSEDGQSIVLLPLNPGEASAVFVRDDGKTEDAKAPETTTIAPNEATLVGKFAGDPATLEETRLSEEQRQNLPMIRTMIENCELELRADNTFKLVMFVDLEGNWKLVDGRLRLQPNKAMGMEAGPDAKNDPIFFMPKGDQLWIQPTKPNDPTFAFVRK